MIRKIIFLALFPASSGAMQETYSLQLLDENSRCSRSTSIEDFFASMEQVVALNQKYQEEHWQNRLRDIQEAQLSADNQVAAGKLIPEFLTAVKDGSEQEWKNLYRAAIEAESIKKELLEQMKPRSAKPTKIPLLEKPRHPIMSVIRIVQRRNNTLPPYTDFCISSNIGYFRLSPAGDELTITTEDNQLHTWSLNHLASKKPSWCSTTRALEEDSITKIRNCGQKIVGIVMGLFFPSDDF
jgi:hypothetical protein